MKKKILNFQQFWKILDNFFYFSIKNLLPSVDVIAEEGGGTVDLKPNGRNIQVTIDLGDHFLHANYNYTNSLLLSGIPQLWW